MNYDEMSDFEIDCEVARKYLPCDYYLNVNQQTVDLISIQTYLGPHGMPDEKEVKYGEFDPCNNWGDAGPIIVENRISLFPTKYTEQGWQAEHAIHGVAKDKSPLRAAMIVYLMMQES